MDDWMVRLKAGVEAGYYKRETGEERLDRLPKRNRPDCVRAVRLERLIRGAMDGPTIHKTRGVDWGAGLAADLLQANILLCWDTKTPRLPDTTLIAVDIHVGEIRLAWEMWERTDNVLFWAIARRLGCYVLQTDDLERGADWARGRYGLLNLTSGATSRKSAA